MGLTRIRAEQISDIDFKQATRVVTTSNITLASGAPNSVDGVNLVVKDRVLVTGQITASQNGIYEVLITGSGTNGTWVRSSDTNATGELDAGAIVMVTEGTIFADTQWKLTTDNPIVIGTTPLTFVQNYSANSIASGSSNVSVYANSNVTISSNGTANVLTVGSTGVVVSGTASVTGNITGSYIIGNGSQLTGLPASYSNANVDSHLAAFGSNTISTTGNITAGYFVGNGSILTSITGANITGTVANATYATSAGTSTTSTQANYANIANSVSGSNVSGSVAQANYANTANSVAGANITGTVANATYALSANVSTYAGTVTTNAQPNITSVGTLSSVSTTGNVNSGNLLTGGQVSATGNITGSNLLVNNDAVITGNLTVNGTTTTINSQTITTNDLAITLGNNQNTSTALNGAGLDIGNNSLATWKFNNATTSWQSNIAIMPTANGTLTLGGASNYWSTAYLTAVSATGNINSGNVLTVGQVSATSNITGGNLLTSGVMSSTGNITGGNLSVGTGTITVNNIVNGGSNAVGNIGSSTTYFNTVFAKATSAQYADVAEKYLADADYPVGTVLAIGGPKEVRNSHNYHGSDVIGTISENPAYIMNGGLTGEFVVTVALLGRVPCRVIGPVLRGDLLAASEIRGVAQTVNPDDYQPGCIIGKALQDYDDSDNVGVIEIIVGRL